MILTLYSTVGMRNKALIECLRTLDQILRLNVAINASHISGGLKHNTHIDHEIVSIRSVKNLNLAALKD
jgi:hypothetical protein